MNEFGLGKTDKVIISNCIYKNIGGRGKSESKNALKNAFLNKLNEDGINYEHIKGNTYKLITLSGKEYLIVISCYGEGRATKNSSYTVGKEIADQMREKYDMDNWYAVFASVTAERELNPDISPRVCINAELESVLTKNKRSSGNGFYYACAKSKTEEYQTFEDWYGSLE